MSVTAAVYVYVYCVAPRELWMCCGRMSLQKMKAGILNDHSMM